MNIDVESLQLDGAVDVPNTFYAQVICTNPNPNPEEMYCEGQYGDYFLFQVTIISEEEIPEYPALQIETPTEEGEIMSR